MNNPRISKTPNKNNTRNNPSKYDGECKPTKQSC